MANNVYSDKIDQYLDGELSQKEVEDFETTMENDPSLEEEVLGNLLLRETIETGYREEMRANIRQWRKEGAQVSTGTNIRKLTVRLAAAASVLLVFGLAVFNLVLPSYSNEGISQIAYIQETDLSGGLKGAGETDVLTSAITNYEAGNYEQAIPLFQQFPDNDKAIYGLAQSYIQTDNFDPAISALKQLIDRGNIDYIEQAEYYLMMTYLKKGDLNTEFYSLLDKIADNGSAQYKEKAQVVRKRLNSFWRSLQ